MHRGGNSHRQLFLLLTSLARTFDVRGLTHSWCLPPVATKEKRKTRRVAATGSAAPLLNVKALAPAGGLMFDGLALHHVTAGSDKDLNDQARQARVGDSHSQEPNSDGARAAIGAETHATAGKMSTVGSGDAVKLVN